MLSHLLVGKVSKGVRVLTQRDPAVDRGREVQVAGLLEPRVVQHSGPAARELLASLFVLVPLVCGRVPGQDDEGIGPAEIGVRRRQHPPPPRQGRRRRRRRGETQVLLLKLVGVHQAQPAAGPQRGHVQKVLDAQRAVVLVQQVQLLPGRQHERAASGVRQHQHAFHRHAHVVPSPRNVLEREVLLMLGVQEWADVLRVVGQ